MLCMVIIFMLSVTPRPDEVHSTCNCKGAYVHQVPLQRIKIVKFSKNCGTFVIKESGGGESIINGSLNSKIIIAHFQNSSGKSRKFSRSRMMKQTTPLSSSREI